MTVVADGGHAEATLTTSHWIRKSRRDWRCMMNKQSMNELWQHVASIAMMDATAYDDSDNYFYRLRRGDDTSGITVLSWDGGGEWWICKYENEEAWENDSYTSEAETTAEHAAVDFNH